MHEAVGELIDFTIFDPGTTHPTRGFPLERCEACGKTGAIKHFEDGTTHVTHYATQGEGYISSSDEEVCQY
jgi:hypothetical protein